MRKREKSGFGRPRTQSVADASFAELVGTQSPADSEQPAPAPEPAPEAPAVETPTVETEPPTAATAEEATDAFGEPVAPTPPPAPKQFVSKPAASVVTRTHSVRLPKEIITRWKEEADKANEVSASQISSGKLAHALLLAYFNYVDAARAAGIPQTEINREWGIADD